MSIRRARFAVSPDRCAVAPARDRVLACARGWGVPWEEAWWESLRLAASELITNAVMHTGGPVTAVLSYDPDEGRLLLVVHDRSAAPPRRRDATADEETGRGLALVDTLAAHTGWEPTRRGKRVWAAFDVPAPLLRSGVGARLRMRIQDDFGSEVDPRTGPRGRPGSAETRPAALLVIVHSPVDRRGRRPRRPSPSHGPREAAPLPLDDLKAARRRRCSF